MGDKRESEPLTVDDARTIWYHVIKKAVDDFKNGRKAKNQDNRSAYLDAKEWLWSGSEEFPSFLYLCQYLGLDFRKIREALRGHELSREQQKDRSSAGLDDQRGGGQGVSGDEGRGPGVAAAEGEAGESSDL